MNVFDWLRRLLDSIFGRHGPSETPGTTLNIRVTVSGDIADPKAVYELLAAEPRALVGEPIVKPDGDIDLRAVRPELVRDPLTQITFDLAGGLRCDGGEYPVKFQRPADAAFNVRGPDGGPPPRGLFRAEFPKEPGRTRLIVIDRNNRSGTYPYCLQIVVPGCGDRPAVLDPSIINR